jgi:hypothetical protein
MGNGYLRSLMFVGATAMIRYAREKGAVSARWINALLEKKPARLVSVAVANKTARLGPARQEGRLSGSNACIRTRLRTRHTIVRLFSLGRVIMA